MTRLSYKTPGFFWDFLDVKKILWKAGDITVNYYLSMQVLRILELLELNKSVKLVKKKEIEIR